MHGGVSALDGAALCRAWGEAKAHQAAPRVVCKVEPAYPRRLLWLDAAEGAREFLRRRKGKQMVGTGSVREKECV